MKKNISDYSIRERIFYYYMFFFAILALITIVANILTKLDFSYNYKWIGLALFCSIMVILTSKLKNTKLFHRIGTYTLALIIVPGSWLTSSGLMSPGIIYSVAMLILINYLLSGWERIILDGVFIIINMALITIYGFYPEVYKSMSAEQQYIDWITNVPIMLIFISVMLAISKNAYETERINTEEKSRELKKLSETDQLTSLHNRTHLKKKRDFIHKTYCRTKSPYSLIMIDIDYFKLYNDFYGHIQGDECLKHIGKILKNSVDRDTDWVYRYGGEEFLLILEHTDKVGAEHVAKQIRRSLENEQIVHEKSDIHNYLTLSIGIATVQNRDDNFETILKHSDIALYRAKENGRNRVIQL